MNFYIAGMYPSTTYNMHWETVSPSGTVLHVGTDYPFTTGTIPSNVYTPIGFSSTGVTGSPLDALVLYSIITTPDANHHIETSTAVDLAGNVVWYSAAQAGAPSVPPVRTETGGNYLGFNLPASPDPYQNGFRESDPAGNPILETSIGAINDQLVAFGVPPITSIHHEVRRITTPTAAAPHGYIMVLANTQYTCTNCQGGTPTNPTDVLGDEIIVMDNNMNVVWAWNPFTHLDVTHPAILGEKCTVPTGSGGCEPFNPAFTFAWDWMHSNALQYTPYDGNIILSSRHQDIVIKVNFANGTGDGHIIWELGNPAEPGGIIGGPGGAPLPTFTLTTTGAGGPDLGYPWFSHNHDPEFAFRGQLVGGKRIFTIFDDGNIRAACLPGYFCDPTPHSRCQEYSLDETNLAANLNINGDAQGYSFALGSSQVLSNGTSIACNSGIVMGVTYPTNTVEIDANSNFIFSLNATSDNYRSWRMQNLYTAVNP
jgi:arylsulfate sulfotransferase